MMKDLMDDLEEVIEEVAEELNEKAKDLSKYYKDVDNFTLVMNFYAIGLELKKRGYLK